MSAEENMALVRRFWEARAKGDLEAMDAMMAPTSSPTLSSFLTNSPAAKGKNGRSPRSLPPSLTAA